MATSLPELSRAEWILMRVLWRQGKSTARQVYEEAVHERDWEYQTVKTMLDRLVSKGYLKAEKLGPLCLFEPAVSKTRVLPRAIDSFVETVLDNTFAPLFAHLAKGKELSTDEIAALRKLLEKQEEDPTDE